jgi:hypothetical protein
VSNSQPLNNDTLYRTYGESHGLCEVAFHAGLTARNGKLIPVCLGFEIDRNLHRHHLYSTNQRPDCWSNLLVVTKEMHDYFHAHQDQARTICCVCKIRKMNANGDPHEFDLNEMFQSAGKHIIGDIERYNFESNAMLDKFRSEALRELEKLSEGIENIRYLERLA